MKAPLALWVIIITLWYKALAAGVVGVPGGLNLAMNRRDVWELRSCGLKPLGDQGGLGSCLAYSRGT